jgi:hypothetical protein
MQQLEEENQSDMESKEDELLYYQNLSDELGINIGGNKAKIKHFEYLLRRKRTGGKLNNKKNKARIKMKKGN